MALLSSLAEVIRSKNASPFRTTLDIFFADSDTYELVRDSGALSRESIARSYNVALDQVEGIYFVEQARGIKVTIRKTYPADHFHSTDCYGAQAHLPLLRFEIPENG
jgi:hypothetical protein